VFREHFAAAVLREGNSLRVRQLTILATDLTNSTTFYSRDGDVIAYEIIRDHFRLMTALAERHSGFVLKTLGDGVLACLPETLSGLHAAMDIQRGMSAFWSKHSVRDNEAHVLRIGLHTGPAILVAPDQQLDVFGTTVNIAFRVARLARGGDILVTNTALDLDPAARRELESLGPTETFQTVLKGFDEDCTIHRLILPTS
jgi:class 3 adenylate cyclase